MGSPAHNESSPTIKGMQSKSYVTGKEAHFPCLCFGHLPKLSRWNLDVGSKLVSVPSPIRAAVQL